MSQMLPVSRYDSTRIAYHSMMWIQIPYHTFFEKLRSDFDGVYAESCSDIDQSLVEGSTLVSIIKLIGKRECNALRKEN